MSHEAAIMLLVIGFTCAVSVCGCAVPVGRQPVRMAEPVADAPGFNSIFRGGYVYFAGQPTADGLRVAADRGVKVVVNLRTEKEIESRIDFDEPALVETLGMEYDHIPITPDTLAAADAARLAGILDGTNGPVLIHCGSSNRVGGLWALYLHLHRDLGLNVSLKHGERAGMSSDAVWASVIHAAEQSTATGGGRNRGPS